MFGLGTRSNNVLFMLLLCILLSACGPSPDELAATSAAETAAAATSTFTVTPTITLSPTATATPTRTPKPPTPTLEPLPGALPEGILVTFLYSCDLSDPKELPPDEYTFILDQPPPDENNLGKTEGFLYVSNLVGSNTTKDLLNHPNVKDGTWWGQAFDLIENAEVIDSWRNISRNEKYYTYALTEGEYVVLRWTQNPHFFWYCGSILVK